LEVREGEVAEYSIADNYYVLATTPRKEIILFSPTGRILYHSKVDKDILKSLVSSNGKYFAVVTVDGFVYFFENRYPEIKEKLIKELNELLAR